MKEEVLGSETENKVPTTDELLKPTAAEEVKKSPNELMTEAISEYAFLSFENGVLKVEHSELKSFLKPRILKIGNVVNRGTILARLNGGATNMDAQTQGLNGCIATVMVGFEENLKIDLLQVEDTDLVMGLYIAVVSYNNFFRKNPLGIIL